MYTSHRTTLLHTDFLLWIGGWGEVWVTGERKGQLTHRHNELTAEPTRAAVTGSDRPCHACEETKRQIKGESSDRKHL